MIHFPNEILSIIINALTADEKENLAALASCRLSCHTLCSLATPLFFSSILLTEDEASYTGSYEAPIRIRAVKLNKILINNNNYHIATSIRTLVLRYHKDYHGLVGGGVIASILARLPYIQDFTLEVLRSHYPLEFSSIPKDLASATQALFRSRHLTRLNLCHISDFPLALITKYTSVQNLRLSTVRFSENVHDTPTMHWDSHLNSLEIDECSLMTLSKCIEQNSSFQEYFSQLKNLRIEDLSGFPIYIWNYGWDIVLATSQHLTTLVIGSSYATSSFLEDCPYDLNWFPSLQHLEIQLNFVLFQVNNTLLIFLNRFLTVSSLTSLVETMHFTLFWTCDESDEPGHTKDLFSPDAGWSALDTTLTSGKFPSLSRVVFDLCINFEVNILMRDSIDEDFYRELELAKRLTLPCIDALLPVYRGLLNSQERTLEMDVSFVE